MRHRTPSGLQPSFQCPLSSGGFNRSTQHYPLQRSGRGTGAISPLRAKILDAALVPRSFRQCQPFIGRSFSTLRALPSAAARTMSVHVPSYACHSNVPEQSGRVLRRPVESTPRKRTSAQHVLAPTRSVRDLQRCRHFALCRKCMRRRRLCRLYRLVRSG
jgi:hypothetical protein